jgi:Ca2+-binding RTX toxin-like protein
MAIKTGTSAADRLTGTASADTLSGLAGNDMLVGRGGADLLDGGAGDDKLLGGAGNDTLLGGDGADTLTGGRGNDTITGGAGSDIFVFAAGDRQDVITDFAAGDTVKITGYASAQSLTQVGSDVVLKLSATDQITFSNTTLAVVQAGLPAAFGGTGTGGTPGSMTGTAGDDTINGTAGNDVIDGLAGKDTINGGAGNDRIIGGLGADTLTGGTGSDVFVYTSTDDSSAAFLRGFASYDTIMDFDVAHDLVDLSAIDANTQLAGNQPFIWGGSGIGHLSTGTFAGTDLVADTDGDGEWDLYIYFGNIGEQNPLSAANFIL